MFILNRNQIRELDQLSIKKYQIPSYQLMNKAGEMVFKSIKKNYPNFIHKKILIICGKGNNGGDGLVVARYLSQISNSVKVIILCKNKDDLSKDCKKQFLKNQNLNLQIEFENHSVEFIKKYKPDLIIDGIFGTGLNRNLTGYFKKIIAAINETKAIKVAIDIPSGLCADTGKILGRAIRSDLTVSFGFPKLGFYQNFGPELVGKIEIVEIGLSKKAFHDLKFNHFIQLIDPLSVQKILKPRKKQTHKGSFEHTYIIATSFGKIGSGVLSTYAALKAGAGLSTLVLPDSCYEKIDLRYLEIMYAPVNDHKSGYLKKSNYKTISKLVDKASVLAIGPGLGTNPSTIELVHQLVKKEEKIIILDADGLNAVAKKISILKQRDWPIILTPHPKEMSRLIKKSVQYIQKNRIKVVRDFCQKYQVYLLLKGYNSIIGFPNGDIWINPTGNPAMANAGQGDALTGILAGVISQHHQTSPELEKAILLAVYLHGMTGDYLASKKNRIVLASDIINHLNDGYRMIQNHQKL